MNGRTSVLLGDVLRVKHGYAFPGAGFGDDLAGPQVLTPSNFSIGGGFKRSKPKSFVGSYPAEYALDAGDLVLSMTDLSKGGDTLGLPARIPVDGVYLHNQRIGLVEITDAERVSAAFLNYYLRTSGYRSYVLGTASGSTVRHTSPSRIQGYVADLPTLDEQHEITAVLSALDDKIALNLELAEASDAYLRAQFILAVKESAQSVPLFDVVKVDFGEAFGGADFSESGVGRPLIRIRDLKSFAPRVWTTEKRAREVVVQPGDILIGMDAEFRATAWLGEPGLLNQRVCRAQSTAFGPAYLREALRAPLASRENEKSATTVIHLNKADLERTEIIVPAPDRLAIFEEIAEPVFAHRVVAAEESRLLAELRDTLLPELMSGRLRVKDAEKKIEEVV